MRYSLQALFSTKNRCRFESSPLQATVALAIRKKIEIVVLSKSEPPME
jgi:hypothetical protein